MDLLCCQMPSRFETPFEAKSCFSHSSVPREPRQGSAASALDLMDKTEVGIRPDFVTCHWKALHCILAGSAHPWERGVWELCRVSIMTRPGRRQHSGQRPWSTRRRRLLAHSATTAATHSAAETAARFALFHKLHAVYWMSFDCCLLYKPVFVFGGWLEGRT